MPTCKKRAYADKHLAEQARSGINKKLIAQGSERLISKAYHCVLCNQWHLTSMSDATLSQVINRREAQHKSFIYREAQHWSHKFGVEFDVADVYDTPKRKKNK